MEDARRDYGAVDDTEHVLSNCSSRIQISRENRSWSNENHAKVMNRIRVMKELEVGAALGNTLNQIVLSVKTTKLSTYLDLM